ncbi:MAG: energy transducer TonB [Ignavibacteriales bacterium]|nr:energy transducer TonB [Ignavibacteriales bacterium]
MAAEEFIIPFNVDYGAIELKRVYQRFTLWSLGLATVVQAIGLGSYWGSVWLAEEEEPIRTVRILKYTDLGPPPSLQNQQAAPNVAISAPSVKPSIGIPVPVPDAEVSPEQTFATQQELSQAVSEVSTATTGGGDLQITIDEEPPDFVAVEKEPSIVKKVEPKYPEIALRAGLEGTVYVKMWVDKEGKVRKVVILKSDAEIFNQNAHDAAMQWVYTPALMQKGPVSVWVAVPFKFRLSNK